MIRATKTYKHRDNGFSLGVKASFDLEREAVPTSRGGFGW